MADKLTEMYDIFRKGQASEPTSFQSFQAGFTAAAVTMRKRAMDECRVGVDVNSIKNAIGSLSDIPK